jgi:hypothetical protein
MIPMHVAIVSVAVHSAHVCQNQHHSISAAASNDRPSNGEKDLVVTPGGPRSRDKVRHVPPGHTVRQNEDGTYEVVPNDGPAGSEPKDKRRN